MYMYVCVCVCMHTYVHMYICTYVCICTYTYIETHTLILTSLISICFYVYNHLCFKHIFGSHQVSGFWLVVSEFRLVVLTLHEEFFILKTSSW